MRSLIRSEVCKLVGTRWFWIASTVGVALGPIQAYVNVQTAGTKGQAELGTTASIHHILATTAITSTVAIGVGIAAMAGEYRSRTCTPTFLITPRRARVVSAKAIVVVAVSAVIAALSFALALAAAVPAMRAKGIDHLAGDTAQMLAGTVLAGALYGALGVAIGAITRNTTVAIVATIVWMQFVEVQFLAAVVPSVGKWLPTGANLAVTHTADHPAAVLSGPAGAVVLCAWTVVLLAVAARRTVRTDV